MKALNKALPGLCIGIGLIVMGCLLSHGIITVKDRDRIVTVKGLAEREVKADRVIWPLVFKEIGNDMTSIYNAVNKKNEIVCDFLKNNGINENEISIAAPQIIDMRAERYANNNEIPYRYNVTSVITVTSNQIDKVRELISRQVDLLKQGVAIIDGDYRYTTQYSFTGLNDINDRRGNRCSPSRRREIRQRFRQQTGKDTAGQSRPIRHQQSGRKHTLYQRSTCRYDY